MKAMLSVGIVVGLLLMGRGVFSLYAPLSFTVGFVLMAGCVIIMEEL